MTSPDLPDRRVDEIRDRTVDRYSGLARHAQTGGIPLDQETGSGCFGAAAYDGDAPEAALRASLGCGNPLTVADLNEGDTVLDLGSGGGLDVVLSARRVGPTGKAYGLDASPDMLTLARTNATQADATNAEFLAGHIEHIPLPDTSVDVVISNCVINLSTDKPRALTEAFRVLRPGGRFGVSDIIADNDLDPAQQTATEQHLGCANGTLTATQYRHELLAAGFTTVTITPTHQTAPGLTRPPSKPRNPPRPTASPSGRCGRPTPTRSWRSTRRASTQGTPASRPPPPPGGPSTPPSFPCTATSPPTPPARSSAGSPPHPYQTAASTPASSNTASTSTPTTTATASEPRSCTP